MPEQNLRRGPSSPGRRLGDGARRAQRAARQLIARVRPAWVAGAKEAEGRPPQPPPRRERVARPDLGVACILDPTFDAALRHEFDLISFGRGDWRAVLERRQPDFLLVESAWRGNGGRWEGAIASEHGPHRALREVMEWCREQSVATVFWSTVDPNSLNLFVEAALLFDHVFTVDEASIERYRGRGHPSVAVLPFAAQPWTHNPILFDGARKRRVGFADSALGDMHASREQTEIILEPATPMGLEIVSLSQSDPKHRFPASLAGSVVESLSYDDVVVADKLYKVAVALSPAGPSSTICPRRIFELLASGATVLTERSAAIERLVGSGMVFESASAEETKTLLRFLLRNDELRDRTAVRAVRKVIRDHTYGHRLDTILRTLGLPTEARRPTVSIICSTNWPAALPTMLANVARQTYRPLELVVVLHGEGFDEVDVSAQADAAGLEEVTIRTCDAERPLGACLNMGCEAAAGQILAKMDDDNYYAPEYLADLVDAFEYSDAGIVGKAAHYTYLSARGMMILRFPKREHRYTTLVQGGTLTMLREVWRELRFEDLAQGEDTTLLRAADEHGVRCYSADRFNYVSVRGADPSQHAWQIDDEELMLSGIVQSFAGRFADVVV